MPRAKTPEEEHAFKLSVSFMPEDYKRMIAYCQKEERSISWVIRKAIREWLDKHES